MFAALVEQAAEHAGLTPRQATALAPGDLLTCIEAGLRREERALERTAWLAAHLINATPGRTRAIDLDDLLGPAYRLRRMQRARERGSSA